MHSVQVEINRGVYLAEPTVEKTTGFGPLRTALERFMDGLADAFRPGTGRDQIFREEGA